MWEYFENCSKCVQEKGLSSTVKLGKGPMRWGWNWPTKLRSLMTLARVFSCKEIKRETEKSLSAFEKFCFEWRPRKGIIAEEGLDSNFFKIHFDVWLTYNTIHQSGVYRSMSFDRCAWVPPQSRCRTFHHIKNFFLFPLISLSSPDLGNHWSVFCHYKWDVSF